MKLGAAAGGFFLVLCICSAGSTEPEEVQEGGTKTEAQHCQLSRSMPKANKPS